MELGLLNLQDLNAVVNECWDRVKHQGTAISSVALGLLLFLGLGCLLFRFLLSRDGEILDSLDSRVYGIFDCVGHVVLLLSRQKQADPNLWLLCINSESTLSQGKIRCAL